MRIGIVCPYSFDAPGGVQFHIRDLASVLIDWGHHVSVLAPAEEGTPLPGFVESAGGSIAVPYNGSVARLSFGPAASARVSRWLAEHEFDILHIHEPLSPSLSLLALWQTRIPTVATFHSSLERSRMLTFFSPLLQSSIEKIDARIAVSAEARRTVADHLGGDAFVIPNGVFVDRFRTATPDDRWRGVRRGGPAPTIAFLGRLDEPRKGLPVFAGAVAPVLRERPDARFLIAGRGEAGEVRAALAGLGDSVEFLGAISDEEKATLFASVDIYVAPQLGGESFGIVLVEAMAGGAHVVASDIPAFRAVIDDGRAGSPFAVGDADDLARALLTALGGAPGVLAHAATWVDQYDWNRVARQVLDVYRTVLTAKGIALPEPGLVARFLRRREK